MYAPTVGFTPSVGVDVAEDDVLVLELLAVELLVGDTTEVDEEVLVGTEVPKGAQVAPKSDASLKVSAKEPLDTPYLVPALEAIE